MKYSMNENELLIKLRVGDQRIVQDDTVIFIIDILTVAVLGCRLLSLGVHNYPVHHSCDSCPSIRHMVRHTQFSSSLIFKNDETGNANQSSSKHSVQNQCILHVTNTDLPFSCTIRGPPESPWHMVPLGCPVTLPYAHTKVL